MIAPVGLRMLLPTTAFLGVLGPGPASAHPRSYEGPRAVEVARAQPTRVVGPELEESETLELGVDGGPHPEAVLVPPSSEDEGVGDVYDPTRDSPEAVEAARLIRGGIILGATGLALAVGAVVMGTRDPCAPRAGNSCLESARNRAALAMAVPGALLLGGGIALLGVGSARRVRVRTTVSFARFGGLVSAAVSF